MTILDECEIRSLLARERFARDTGQFQTLRESFHPDASKTMVHIMWYVFSLTTLSRRHRYSEVLANLYNRYDGDIDGFVSASKKLYSPTVSIMHQIMPTDIDVRGSKALAQSWCIIDTRFERSGSEYDAKTYVRLFNQCEKVDGRWKLLTLEAIYLRDSITPVYPAKEPDYGDLSGFRKSYRFTAWMVAQRGLTIRNDLAGEDDPKSMEDLLNRNHAWIETL
jgi:hypothetical protein